MPPLKAAALYRLARQLLDPTLIGLGFRRTTAAAGGASGPDSNGITVSWPSGASWQRRQGDGWLIIYVALSEWNSSVGPGYTFAIDLRLSNGAKAMIRDRSQRLPTLMTDREREDLRHLENRIIAKLPPPNMAVARMLDPWSREQYLAGWKARAEPYGPKQDVWFRQGNEADAREVFALCARVLPGAIDRLVGSPAAVE